MNIARNLMVMAVALANGAAYAQYTDGVVKIGVLTDMSSLYSDISRRRLGRRGEARGRGFRRCRQGHEGGDRRRRPSEQAGCRLEHRQHLVRCRQGRRDRRRAEFRRRARGERDRAPEEQAVPGDGPGDIGPHRPEVQRQYNSLGLRHLGARQWHRQGDREERRGHLVFPHRRLRLRICARTRHRGGGRSQWRQGGRQGPGAPQQQRLLLVPAAGAGLQGQGDRTRQCGRRYHQFHQAGLRVRHRPAAARASPASWCR